MLPLCIDQSMSVKFYFHVNFKSVSDDLMKCHGNANSYRSSHLNVITEDKCQSGNNVLFSCVKIMGPIGMEAIVDELE